jgi:hypothetical protein
MNHLSQRSFAGLTLALCSLLGCGSPALDEPIPAAGMPRGAANDHVGPHQGQIIELGRSHEYHAELVEDEKARKVTIYILDKAMKELPIDQEAVSITLSSAGKSQTFDLAAANRKEGKTAQFDSDEKLHEAMEKEPKVKLRLTVTIAGKPYSGDVTHDHDHKGHKH